MCGIAGIFSPHGRAIDPDLLVKMTTTLRHRGPDDEGYLFADTQSGNVDPRRGRETIPEITLPDVRESLTFEPPRNLGLGWRRLSIIDLSPSGHQPMANEEKTIWIIFNGEIYNYIELREELREKGHSFRTQSDTEVLIHAYQEWGIECLHHLNGMWAFALYDVRKKQLFCSRDRFGIKPFYYTWNGTTFLFASEIKALLESASLRRQANDAPVFDFLQHRVLDHTDQTFFDGVSQLRPGHFLQLDEAGVHIHRYYSLSYSPELGRFDETECRRHAQEFRNLFTESVRIHLRSDVTLGSCLSGGLDSSSIVCTANELMFGDGVVNRDLVGEKQKTFTATYDDERFSEDRFVRKVIEKTNAAAHFIQPTGDGLRNEFSRFIRAHDEPVISTSMYAQWNVMKLAAQNKVKVLLDGQGGDELLAGYRWHFPVFHADLLKRGRIGSFFHEVTEASNITGMSSFTVAVLAKQKFFKRFVPNRLLGGRSPLSRYLNEEFASTHRRRRASFSKSDDDLQRRLWEEETQFNLQQLLHYEDRNSMAFSIEARVPFVNYRLIEYVMQLPAVYKIHDGWSKYVLRRAMEGVIPADIQWRKDKMGFVTPEEEWLKELRPTFAAMLRTGEFRSGRYVKQTEFLRDLEAGTLKLHSSDIWRLINLELWMREFDVS